MSITAGRDLSDHFAQTAYFTNEKQQSRDTKGLHQDLIACHWQSWTQDPGFFPGWGPFQGISASLRLGGESREPWLVFPDRGLALQTPAFAVRVSKYWGLAAVDLCYSFSFLTIEKKSLISPCNWCLHGQTSPRWAH